MSNSGLGYAIFITLEVVVVSHKCTKERLQIFACQHFNDYAILFSSRSPKFFAFITLTNFAIRSMLTSLCCRKRNLRGSILVKRSLIN